MSEQFELFTPEAVAPEQKTKKTGAKYPALKIVSMILGILAGIAFIVYAARYTKQYLEQIAQYKGMGMDIPQSTLNVIYIQLALTFVAGLLPILGAVFSNKLAKLSAVLTAAPICWGLTNAIPTIIISIVQKAEFKDLIDVILLGAGGLLALISAIFIIATPAYSEDGEDGSFEEFRIDGADNVAFDISDEVEAAEEKAEDALDFAKDAVDDVAEGAADAVEEAKEAVSDIAEDVAEEVKDAASDVVEGAAEAVEEAKEAVSDIAEDVAEEVKDAASDVVEDAAEAVEEAKEAVSDIAEDVAEEVKDAASDITGKDE